MEAQAMLVSLVWRRTDELHETSGFARLDGVRAT